jgi:hypothetical protein
VVVVAHSCRGAKYPEDDRLPDRVDIVVEPSIPIETSNSSRRRDHKRREPPDDVDPFDKWNKLNM